VQPYSPNVEEEAVTPRPYLMPLFTRVLRRGSLRTTSFVGRAEKRVPTCSFVEPGGLLRDNEVSQPALRIRRSRGRRRRGFDEFEDETREPAPGGSGGGWIVAATFIKYGAIIIVVLIVAYVVLRIPGVLQSSF